MYFMRNQMLPRFTSLHSTNIQYKITFHWMLLDKTLVFVVMRWIHMNYYLDFRELSLWPHLGLGSPHSDPTESVCVLVPIPGAWAGGSYPWSQTPRPGPGPRQVFREGLLNEWDEESKGSGLHLTFTKWLFSNRDNSRLSYRQKIDTCWRFHWIH